MKQKALIIFKGLSLKQTKHFFFEGESPSLKVTSARIQYFPVLKLSISIINTF